MPDSKDLVALAGQLRARILALDSFMDNLCAATCRACTDNCCRRATVWYDFKDLLYLHLASTPFPAGQLISHPGQICRYLTAAGCELPRTQRPFVCTWYVCAAQMGTMDCWPQSSKAYLLNSLEALKEGRYRMERLFIQMVVG